jgi:hypothetical protein
LANKTKVIQFFQSMPTSYCLVELLFYRNMQSQRMVDPNDLNDIMSLSIALPYTDVVVTEKIWHTAILQTKLDRLRPTRVLRTPSQLIPLLPRREREV